MDISRLKLLVHTVRYLRFKQVYYRIYYALKNRFFIKPYDWVLPNSIVPLDWEDSFLNRKSYEESGKFKFLNLPHVFTDEINWNFSDYGKLWTYNLNYFDFINQEDITQEAGLYLIRNHIRQNTLLKDAKEAYPISLRSINWIKFLSKFKIQQFDINQALFNDYNLLIHNLEYHLLGNHLLENAFSLFFGAYYFKDETFYGKSKRLLGRELEEQILNDGAHFELSPMYHQILLHRLLDCINLVELNSWKKDGFDTFLKKKAERMISWLKTVTFSNGNIPMVNDSAYGIAPTSDQLFTYAKKLGLRGVRTKLSDSGYRMLHGNRYELFIDVGNIGPTYQPGHAHADTFNFELYVDGNPLIVDTGVSTYEKNELRQQQRGTAAHNTVMIAKTNQTQVWGGFRVAKRARITTLEELQNIIVGTHDGYKNFGMRHTRSFQTEDNKITILDKLSKGDVSEQRAFLHFHPKVGNIKFDSDLKGITLADMKIHLVFEGNVLSIEKNAYEYANGFNETETAEKITILFRTSLKTLIEL